MDRETVLAQLIEIFGEIQEVLEGTTQQITPSTVPFGGIEGFDSLAKTVATTGIANKFDLPDDEKLDKLFAKKERSGTVTLFSIEQIADKIIELKKDK